MKEKLREIRNTLNRNIFVGARLESNLRSMGVASYIIMAMGVVMTAVNLAQRQYIVALSPFAFLIAGIISNIYAVRLKRREGAIIVTMIAIIFVLSYDVIFVDNGFAFLWTLMVPLAVAYMFSVKMGILISVYFELLFVLMFCTPLRRFVEGHYSDIVMLRFPLLYFFSSLLTLYVMYQYHKSVLIEIDYSKKLSEEVKRQTAVAEERSRRIEQMSFQTIQTLAHAIDAKDPYTRGHSSRVSQYSAALAEALGWDKDRVNDLRYAALLHDMGKIGVPDSILNNPRCLTEVEYDIIKSHTTMGGDILKNRIMIETAEDVARSHHERYDGKGYPSGLAGEAISEEARVVAIADAFDAMSSNRVYRKACDPDHIRRELEEGRGKQFDPVYVEVFTDLWRRGLLDDIIGSESKEEDTGMEVPSALLQEVMEAFMAQSAAEELDLTTGIMGRSSGESLIASTMQRESGCFVFFDVDNLKKVNDTNGHEAGDRVLRMMGDTLKDNSANSLCCRLGGDEFLLFIKDAARDEAEERVQKIIRDFEAKKNENAATAAASLSAGLVMCTPADPYSKVYNRADKALYHVKQTGKNSYGFYDIDAESSQDGLLDINDLVSGIRSSGSYEGALDVEYRQFARLFEFVSNLEARFSHPFQLVMISVDVPPDVAVYPEELEKAMYYMEQSIRQTIRNVDVLTRYSRQQFLIILLGTDSDGVKIAVDRIFRGYYKMNGSGAFSPSYSVASPEPSASGAPTCEES